LNYISDILEVYTLEEILEQSDRTIEETLQFLVENKFVSLPEFQPLDYE